MKTIEDGIEELQKLLEIDYQYWILGAGVSLDSNIPLMYPLTKRVEACLEEPNKKYFQTLIGILEESCHVEHVLSHLGDLIAIAERSRSKNVLLGTDTLGVAQLNDLYKAIIENIARTIRYGYKAERQGEPEQIGTLADPIVEVENHKQFISQLFKRRANLEPRSKISFITTNYDTLIEDALTLEKRVAVDGFSGSAIAFWTGLGIDIKDSLPQRSHRVLKLHGSVDWFKSQDSALLRVRYGVKYLADLSNTLIYPQATKYVETQKDPFSKIFDAFRKSLAINESHVVPIIGYSFGDEHINSIIEHALTERNNKTNIVAFSQELINTDSQSALAPTLDRWRNDTEFGSRIYIASDKALYCGKTKLEPIAGQNLDWWTFAGLTKFLGQGAPK